MVLQRDRRNLLWGWDEPEREVRVTLEGQGVSQSLRARTAAEDGRFELELPELPAGGPYTLSIEGSSTERLEDVLVGDVWIASGQSNMEWTVAMSDGADREIAEAQHPQLRCLFVTRTPSQEPAARASAAWRVVSPKSVGDVSAVGYFFARELHRTLGVPIGFVDAAWGGTRVEAWTSARALATVLDLGAERARYVLAPHQLEETRRHYAARLLAWQKASLPADPGPRSDSPKLASPDASTAEWRELRAPGSWQSAGMRFNGVVWYRKEIELPASFARSALALSLGAIDDFDHTYFNGRAVGSHPAGTAEAHQIRRKYAVPLELVNGGRNVIAVRVFDHFGEGGLMGPAHEMYVESRGERISLAGDWQVHVELEIPLVPAAVFATYPPPPPALQPQNAPAALWNGMIAPLVPFGIAGALFYQGESNVDVHAEYRRRFVAMIRDWRSQFGQGQFPFFYAQLAGFGATDAWALLREAQSDARTEPATGMACTIDIGDENDIHPRNKLEVGRRLARLALRDHYARHSVVAQGPSLSRLEIRGHEAVVHLSSAEGLASSDGGAVRGFELAGRDGAFHPAAARIEASSVHLSSESVARPHAVRYAFHDFVDVNLVNAAGLPAEPFRTDA
jgi:sialate O-acetylesterase